MYGSCMQLYRGLQYKLFGFIYVYIYIHIYILRGRLYGILQGCHRNLEGLALGGGNTQMAKKLDNPIKDNLCTGSKNQKALGARVYLTGSLPTVSFGLAVVSGPVDSLGYSDQHVQMCWQGQYFVHAH